MLKSFLLKRLFHIIQRSSGTKLVMLLQSISGYVWRATFNPSYDFENNGEMRALNIVCHHLADPILFDVGAHKGGWSKAAHDIFHAARIYAFEPNSLSFEKLQEVLYGTGVASINAGLSNETQERELVVSVHNSQKTSTEITSAQLLHQKIKDYQSHTARFLRGDKFCTQNNIDHITYLKIDTEGHDLKVLQGFENMLRESRIDVIQFEYNRLNIYAKSLLFEFYHLLEDHFVIGRIYPNTIGFKPYDPLDETFIDGNYLCVRKEFEPLITQLVGN